MANEFQTTYLGSGTPIGILQGMIGAIAGQWYNTAADNFTGTQSYGLAVASGFAVTGGLMEVNHFGSNATSALDMLGTFKGLVANNYGFPTFTVTGCAPGTPVGQGDAGSFTAGATSCTPTILANGTASISAPNGYACSLIDVTTPSDILTLTASTATGCTFSGTVGSGDKLLLNGRPY